MSQYCSLMNCVIMFISILTVFIPHAVSLSSESSPPNFADDIVFSHHYHLKENGNSPIYERHYKGSKIKSFQVQDRVSKRAVSKVNITTRSFIISLTCNSPFGEPVPPNNETDTCIKVKTAIIRAANRLETYIYLPIPVRVSLNFNSFCEGTNGAQRGKTCPSGNPTLGYASPGGWHVFTPSNAARFGLQPGYSYPTALARQYVPNDTNLASTQYDISAAFNSDYNWYFPDNGTKFQRSDSSIWGSSQNIAGGFFNQSTIKSYDFEGVVIHEFLHGFGYISSWGRWVDGDTFLPSWLDWNSNGTLNGLAPQFIFNRWMSDGLNGVWLTTYTDFITKGVSDAIKKGGANNWYSVFKSSAAGKISSALIGQTGLFQTPNGVLYWYPRRPRTPSMPTTNTNGSFTSTTQKLDFAIIYTPRNFSDGSSLSHVDANYYRGTSNFLMRPSATAGVDIDALVPGYFSGPMGEVTLGILRSMGYITA